VAIGSVEFLDEFDAELEKRRTGASVDADVSLPRRRVALDTIATAVARRYGVAVDRLRDDGRRADEARIVAVGLACRLSRETQQDIGVYSGGVDSSAVGKWRATIRSEKQRDPTTKRLKDISKLERQIIRDRQ
jgi:chromosomal replication initiation ATPase DnaA